MGQDESGYYERRAEEALELAQRATHPAVAKAHYQMAELYLERMLECRTPKYGPVENALFGHWNGAALERK